MTPTQTCRNISLVITVALSYMPLLCASQDTPRPKLVVSGQIARMDSVTKSFELKSQREVNNDATVADGVTLGTKIGRTAPGQGTSVVGDPVDTSQKQLPANGPYSLKDLAKRFPAVRTAVFLTETTICKDGKKVILCGELKMNDSVQVIGDENSGPRGSGIYATEILRTRQLR
jgi:hypothetical protein